jgi:hypothetical protein
MYHRPRQLLNLCCPIFRGNFDLGIKRNDEPLERYNQSYISQVYDYTLAHEMRFFTLAYFDPKKVNFDPKNLQFSHIKLIKF